MPFIDVKITRKLNPEDKEKIKEGLGSMITLLGKSETYLMVGIDDGYDLWLGGRKLEDGAYISVSLFGNSSSESYDRMTGAICAFLEEEYGLKGSSVYVTYHPVKDWGWNGSNF